MGCFRLSRDLYEGCGVETSTFSYEECLSVLQTCGGISREDQWGFESVRGSAVFGLLEGGKVAGSSERLHNLSRYLNEFVGHQGCEAPWTTLCVSCNELPDLEGYASLAWPCWVAVLGKVKGGGIG